MNSVQLKLKYLGFPRKFKKTSRIQGNLFNTVDQIRGCHF